MNNNTVLGMNVLLLSRMLKLTESWGESKTDFLRFSEFLFFCIQEGGGQKVKRDKSNLKYTKSKLVKKSLSKRKNY